MADKNASAGLLIRRAGQGPARPNREPQGDGSHPGAGRPIPWWPAIERRGRMGSINRRPIIVRARPGRPRIEAIEE